MFLLSWMAVGFLLQVSPTSSRLRETEEGTEQNQVESPASYSRDPWLLHDLSSPIFMRFFDTASTWIEAEAVCRKHFGHLVRDGNGNEAAVHDFLTSLDVHSEVWIGLHQATPLDRFHWIDDVLPPPRSFEAIGSTPSSLWGEFTEDHEMGMCVSVDPQSGYRWNTRYCSGPDKAAFVCQIPVPKWILEGRCNMGLFMQHNTASSHQAGKGDDNDDPVTTIINRIEYFPHNDTLHAIYRCSHENSLRIRTCTFTDNVRLPSIVPSAAGQRRAPPARPKGCDNLPPSPPTTSSTAWPEAKEESDWGCDFSLTLMKTTPSSNSPETPNSNFRAQEKKPKVVQRLRDNSENEKVKKASSTVSGLRTESAKNEAEEEEENSSPRLGRLVLASNVLQFQDGSKAAVAAGNARNKMDGINSEQEEVLVVVTSSSPTKTKRAAATTSRNSTEKEDHGRFLALRPGPWTSVGLRFPNMRHQQDRDLWPRTAVNARKQPQRRFIFNTSSTWEDQDNCWSLKLVQKGRGLLEDLGLLKRPPPSITSAAIPSSTTQHKSLS